MLRLDYIGLATLVALLRVVAAHGANSQALDENFDHLSTGFPLVGLHVLQRCESCHVDAVFHGLPTQCAGCHDGKLARGKHVNHVPTVQQCDVCHTTRGFSVSAKMDHSATSAPCVSCHNGIGASGKTGDHFETTPNCAACHRTVIWAPAFTFDHREIARDIQCVACHDGTQARGKSASHVQSSNDCVLCHSMGAFRPPKKVDHRAIKGSCDTAGCHSCVFLSS